MAALALAGLVLSAFGWFMPWIRTERATQYSGSFALEATNTWFPDDGFINPMSHSYVLVALFLITGALLLWTLRNTDDITPLAVVAVLAVIILLMEAMFVLQAVAEAAAQENVNRFDWWDLEWEVGTFMMVIGQALLIVGAFAEWVQRWVQTYLPLYRLEDVERRAYRVERKMSDEGSSE